MRNAGARSYVGANEADRRIIVLVGPKGSGKTTIGKVLTSEPGVHFLEVEAIAKRVLVATGGVIDEEYARRAFDEILREVEALDGGHRGVVLETTGASEETPRFLDALVHDVGHVVRRRHEVRLHARAETCAKRIAERDPSRQVEVPLALVREMHTRTEALRLEWDLEIVNDPPLDRATIARTFAPLLPEAPRASH